MENFGAKIRQNQNTQNPPMKSDKCLLSTLILLRILAIAFTLAATSMILTSKQAVTVFGIEMDARYSYSSAFKFFAIANMIGCAFSVLSLILASVLGHKTPDPKNYFYMFVHDLVHYDGIATGWMCSSNSSCDHVDKFCRKVSHSIMLSYVAMILYLCLTIISANQSRKIIV
ncbi:hypothetical protein R3W88_017952 [Solanum pinnatisectum]|uniref:CASP-like protein n=1 Tax=Solanum pinnatisectum TaxID=50273 RepID=A0AAV9L4A3_9SOLN|nr:hypothetical protein R3W88_017952 [Solanum pinnatisectum]